MTSNFANLLMLFEQVTRACHSLNGHLLSKGSSTNTCVQAVQVCVSKLDPVIFALAATKQATRSGAEPFPSARQLKQLLDLNVVGVITAPVASASGVLSSGDLRRLSASTVSILAALAGTSIQSVADLILQLGEPGRKLYEQLFEANVPQVLLGAVSAVRGVPAPGLDVGQLAGLVSALCSVVETCLAVDFRYSGGAARRFIADATSARLIAGISGHVTHVCRACEAHVHHHILVGEMLNMYPRLLLSVAALAGDGAGIRLVNYPSVGEAVAAAAAACISKASAAMASQQGGAAVRFSAPDALQVCQLVLPVVDLLLLHCPATHGRLLQPRLTLQMAQSVRALAAAFEDARSAAMLQLIADRARDGAGLIQRLLLGKAAVAEEIEAAVAAGAQLGTSLLRVTMDGSSKAGTAANAGSHNSSGTSSRRVVVDATVAASLASKGVLAAPLDLIQAAYLSGEPVSASKLRRKLRMQDMEDAITATKVWEVLNDRSAVRTMFALLFAVDQAGSDAHVRQARDPTGSGVPGTTAAGPPPSSSSATYVTACKMALAWFVAPHPDDRSKLWDAPFMSQQRCMSAQLLSKLHRCCERLQPSTLVTLCKGLDHMSRSAAPAIRWQELWKLACELLDTMVVAGSGATLRQQHIALSSVCSLHLLRAAAASCVRLTTAGSRTECLRELGASVSAMCTAGLLHPVADSGVFDKLKLLVGWYAKQGPSPSQPRHQDPASDPPYAALQHVPFILASWKLESGKDATVASISPAPAGGARVPSLPIAASSATAAEAALEAVAKSGLLTALMLLPRAPRHAVAEGGGRRTMTETDRSLASEAMQQVWTTASTMLSGATDNDPSIAVPHAQHFANLESEVVALVAQHIAADAADALTGGAGSDATADCAAQGKPPPHGQPAAPVAFKWYEAALVELGVKFGCSNLSCFNMVKDRKYQACGGCRRVWYCGKDCQSAAWQRHKGVCRATPARIAL